MSFCRLPDVGSQNMVHSVTTERTCMQRKLGVLWWVVFKNTCISVFNTPKNRPDFCVKCSGILWSSGQSSWLQIQRSRVRFPTLPDFLRSSASGTASTRPREDSWELFQGNSGSGLGNEINGRGGPLRWPRDALYPLKLALTSPTSCGRSVGIVRLRTKTTELVFFVFVLEYKKGKLKLQLLEKSVVSMRYAESIRFRAVTCLVRISQLFYLMC
jgi:hypothetical protein